MKKRRKSGISIGLFLVLCLLVCIFALLFTGYSYFKVKYTGEQARYGQSALKTMNPNSLEYQIAHRFFVEEELPEETPVVEKRDYVNDGTTALERILSQEEDLDVNGDGIYIDHIYAGTYEGYMMVVKDPKDVSIAINPDMGSGAAAPELEDYVALHQAAGGINGGGFADAGGTGNGSIPAGITIIDGKLISGGAPQAIVGITKDHKLITTTVSAEQALDMGVVEAVTFGPTFIYNGQVVYQPGTDNLNMLNPRTAVGQKADGTMLLLVIDGRGPSSFGAKYEDVVDIFLEYEAVMAGNLDGGNSSVMIYDDQYIHYPVSMYDSRNLPSVFLVKAKK